MPANDDKTITSSEAFQHRSQECPDPSTAGSVRFDAEDRDVVDALEQLATYRRTLGGPEFRPPVELTRRMASLFGSVRPDLVLPAPDRTTLRDRAVRTVQRISATLAMDTGAISGGVAGLRAAADRRTRQVAFVSEVADLDLEMTRAEPAGMPWSIVGQLGMSTVPPKQTIWFVPAGRVPVTGELEPTSVDAAVQVPVTSDGYFRVSLVAGDWVGLVEVGDAVVLFREIRV